MSKKWWLLPANLQNEQLWGPDQGLSNVRLIPITSTQRQKWRLEELDSILTLRCSFLESAIVMYWARWALKWWLLKLKGLKKKSQVQDFPLSPWFSQRDGSELGEGCRFCPGCGFGSDQGTQSTNGDSGWPGNVCSDTVLFALLRVRAFLMTDHSGNVNISVGGFALPLGLVFGSFPFLWSHCLTWETYSGKLMADYPKEEGKRKPTQLKYRAINSINSKKLWKVWDALWKLKIKFIYI